MSRSWSVVCCVLLVGLTLAPAPPAVEEAPPAGDLPRLWQTLWADDVSRARLRGLKSQGFDGLFKCVALPGNFPDEPIFAGGEWRLVERDEGHYDWRSLRTCLDNALAENMWFIPEVVINIPPAWFIDRHPQCLLRDSRGLTGTDPDKAGAPYLLSPWFVANGAADAYLQPFIASFLDVVSEYPNVPAVMIGNFKLNVLPWRMGTDSDDNFTYWSTWDAHALSSYAARFGPGSFPPETWGDYEAMTAPQQEAFKDWLTAAMEVNLQHRYVPWTSGFPGWKVFNASIWNVDGVRPSVFTTGTPEMAAAKQAAMAAAGVDRIVINDDNMGDCGLELMQQEDVELAHSHGFLIFGERVPELDYTWAEVYDMWQGFDPLPDGFINLEESDGYWAGRFRSLYGAPTQPLTPRALLPMVLLD